MEARSCPAEATSHSFTIKPAGFRDTLEVAVTYSCLCGCTGRAVPASAKCSGNGTYACGLCDCQPGYLGARCECQEGAGGELHQALCREAEGKPLCSGRGECSCNQCLCYESEFGNIYGPFCECDDFSCARYKGVLCSGRSLPSLVPCVPWRRENCPEMGKVAGMERAGNLPCFWRICIPFLFLMATRNEKFRGIHVKNKNCIILIRTGFPALESKAVSLQVRLLLGSHGDEQSCCYFHVTMHISCTLIYFSRKE